MAQKTEGYIDLEWTCPNCQSNNPGPQKTCQSCGSPQPTDVKFHLPGEAKLKTDEATAEMAAAGSDIHCPYCGARNPGNAAVCAQCGGDLAGGTRRQAGQVVGAFSSTPGPQVTCSNCGHFKSSQRPAVRAMRQSPAASTGGCSSSNAPSGEKEPANSGHRDRPCRNHWYFPAIIKPV